MISQTVFIAISQRFSYFLFHFGSTTLSLLLCVGSHGNSTRFNFLFTTRVHSSSRLMVKSFDNQDLFVSCLVRFPVYDGLSLLITKTDFSLTDVFFVTLIPKKIIFNTNLYVTVYKKI